MLGEFPRLQCYHVPLGTRCTPGPTPRALGGLLAGGPLKRPIKRKVTISWRGGPIKRHVFVHRGMAEMGLRARSGAARMGCL